jgi:hypothetical protein
MAALAGVVVGWRMIVVPSRHQGGLSSSVSVTLSQRKKRPGSVGKAYILEVDTNRSVFSRES